MSDFPSDVQDIIRTGRFVTISMGEGLVVLALDEAGKLRTEGDVVKSSLPDKRTTYDALVRLGRELLAVTGNLETTEASEEQQRLRVHSAFILGALHFAPERSLTREQLNDAFKQHYKAIHAAAAPEMIATAKMLEALRKGAEKP